MANSNIEFPELDIPTEVAAETTKDNRITPRDFLGSGTLPGTTVIRLGDTNIVIDAANRQIRIGDGTVDRVLMGYQSGGF